MNTKFEVGDKVKQSTVWEASRLSPAMFAGEVTDVHPVGGFYPYSVSFAVSGTTWLFHEDELELAE